MSDGSDAYGTAAGPTRSLADYWDIVRRNRWYLIVPALVVAVVGLGVVRLLPAQYQSTATILIESQQIPQDLVRTTITSYVDERIEFIRQKVLTRANILQILEKFSLYPGQGLSQTDLVARFEQNLEIERISARTGGRTVTTVAFTLSFFHESPRMAQLVANELATLFLNENVASRSARAAETTQFLRDEAGGIQAEIREQEARISEFKLRNQDRLPELTQMNMARLERLQQEYQSSALTLAGLERDLRFLRAQADGGAVTRAAAEDPAAASLGELRARLDRLLLDFTESHPDVQRLRRLIAVREAGEGSGSMDAEQAAGGGAEAEVALAAASPALAREIETVLERIEFLRERREDMRAEIDQLEDRINQAPAIEQEWKDLQRGLENLVTKYEELKDKELEARMAQSLEEEQKGERFVLLEPPIVPQAPARPERAKLYAMVLAAAGAVGGGIMVLAELLSPGLRGEGVLAYHLGAVPLAVIPYLATPGELERRRRLRALNVAAAVMAVVALLVLAHLFLMPLDVLAVTVARKLGII